MAAGSEATSRLPGLPFGWTVAATSLVLLVIGAVVNRHRLPLAIRSASRPGGQAA